MANKKRILLSLQVHNTQKLLVTFLTFGCVILGTIYIFLFNSVAMRGYVLQQETVESIYCKMIDYFTSLDNKVKVNFFFNCPEVLLFDMYHKFN